MANGAHDTFTRYTRQLALPDISYEAQKHLAKARVLVVGAGGLGAAALPYLAGAGIGHITIIDHDEVSTANLHRQTIYQDAQTGQNKAKLAANYIAALNPEISVEARTEKLTASSYGADNQGEATPPPSIHNDLGSFDLILDGTDNFETKTLLNDLSIKTATPLITASVNQFAGQAAILGGYIKDAPCYHCLFPSLPTDARNCNEAGILGTAAGLMGLYQAHLSLCFLLNIGQDNQNNQNERAVAAFDFGSVLSCDYKSLRMAVLALPKDPSCPHCATATQERKREDVDMDEHPIEIIHPNALSGDDTLIIDVRTEEEIAADPIAGALHMELSTIPTRYTELPHGKRLAFACAANIRSAQAAAFVQAMGYENICIYDKLAP